MPHAVPALHAGIDEILDLEDALLVTGHEQIAFQLVQIVHHGGTYLQAEAAAVIIMGVHGQGDAAFLPAGSGQVFAVARIDGHIGRARTGGIVHADDGHAGRARGIRGNDGFHRYPLNACRMSYRRLFCWGLRICWPSKSTLAVMPCIRARSQSVYHCRS